MRSHTSPLRLRAALALAALCLAAAHAPARQQQPKPISGHELDRALTMLNSVREDIRKNYFDITYRGIDLDARFKEAEARVRKATRVSDAFRVIAQAVVDLGDSHTYFVPPVRATRFDYGWEMYMMGDACYVLAVKPKSDAEAKGLRPGDRILRIDRYEPNRADLPHIKYVYYQLAPRETITLQVQSPGQPPRSVEVKAKAKQGRATTDLNDPNVWDEMEREAENVRKVTRQRFHEEGGLFIWRMPHFDISESKVDEIMGRARQSKAMILDLRGNGGGPAVTLQRLVGNFFDREVKIADLKGRKELKPLVAKSRGADAYKGQLIVLVDSMSGSASEVFARVVQLEKRGTVIGDRTAGAVMISRYYGHQGGADVVYYYGTSVTYADLIMTDGRSLEGSGVTPDEVALLTAEEMAAGRDPVLARAAAKLGFELSPEKAGTLFPFEWIK